VSVLEFQGYPGNDIVVAMISFPGTRINHKVQIETIKKGEETQP
jgi:hypothetical protein